MSETNTAETIKKWYSLEGMLKKKRDAAIISTFDSSVDRYFKFWCQGKIFCYYESKIVKTAILICRITRALPEPSLSYLR